jgi:hypothetical protein
MKIQIRLMTFVVWVLAALVLGCQSSTQQGTNQSEQNPQNAPTEAQRSGKASAKARRGTRPEVKAEPRVEALTVPAGTALPVRLVSTIDTGKTPAGTEFEATLADALVVNGVEVAPVGTTVTGRVTNVVSSGRLNRPAELSLVLTSLTPEGGSPVAISTSTWSMKGQSHKKRDIEMIGGGAGVGAVIGAIAGKGKGAAIGSAVGAGAGTAGAMITGKKEILLPPETKLNFTLSAPVTLSRTKG